MHEIISGAISVFLGIILTIIVLWIIALILYTVYQDKYFSKDKQNEYKENIKKYINSEKK